MGVIGLADSETSYKVLALCLSWTFLFGNIVQSIPGNVLESQMIGSNCTIQRPPSKDFKTITWLYPPVDKVVLVD